jgi:hypothetical protein
VRKLLVGLSIVVAMAGSTGTAYAKSTNLEKKCKAGDQAACKQLAYQRCLDRAKKNHQPPSVCNGAKP